MTNPINKAREILLNQNINGFAPNVENIENTAFGSPIRISTFADYARETGVPLNMYDAFKDGCAVVKGNVRVILYRVKDRRNRWRWTVAHEIGHIALGHSEEGDSQENQANRFAGELLAPELVLLELQKRLCRPLCAEEVSRLFAISKGAAELRLEQIQKKEIFSAYLKKEIMEKYKAPIERYTERGAAKCGTLLI